MLIAGTQKKTSMNNQENGAFGTADPNAKTDSASGLLAKNHC